MKRSLARCKPRVLWLIKGLGPGGAEQLLLLAARVVDRDRFTFRLAHVRPDKTHLVPEFEALAWYPSVSASEPPDASAG